MTSKISSAKLLKEAVKRDGAAAIFLLVGFFCYYPVIGMLLLHDSWFDSVKNAQQYINELYMYGIANPFLFCVTFGAALLLGILQFSYLHSAEKVDFYHSLPVRREKIFGIRYAAGALVWLVPFAVNILLFVLVCAMRGIAILEGAAAGGSLPVLLVEGILAHSACFLLVYSLTALAMILTGKVFAALAVVIVFCSYVPAIRLLQEVLMEFYFNTFYASPDLGKSFAVHCSPVYAYIRICGDTMKQVFPADIVIAMVLISALICALCLYLYRRRNSEMAGKPMAFRKIARVAKFLLAVPITLICTVFFYAVTGENLLWGIFGWIFSLLLISGIIEFIYRMDIREVFCDKKQIALTGVVTLAILAVFQMDLLGYDSWLPEKTEVESVNIGSNFVMPAGCLGVYEQSVAKDGTVVLGVTDYVDYESDMDLWYDTGDLDAVFDLVKHSEAFDDGFSSETGEYPDYYWSGRIAVTWHLKDGTQKMRCYEYTAENLVKWLAPLWEQEDYKIQTNPVLNVDPEDVLMVMVAPADSYFPDAVIMRNGNTADSMTEENGSGQTEYAGITEDGEKTDYADVAEHTAEYAREAMAEAELLSPQKPLSGAQLKKLAETVQQDLKEETLAETLAGHEWDMQILYRGENGRVYGQTINLSTGLADTIALLKEYGYELEDAA